MRTPVTRTCALVLSACACAFASPAARAGIFDDCRTGIDCRRVSVAELDHLRGGFTFTNGRTPLHVSFGIAQAVVVNDELVAVTQLRLPDVGTLLASFSAGTVDLSALANALKSMNVQATAGAASSATLADRGGRAGEAAAAASAAAASALGASGTTSSGAEAARTATARQESPPASAPQGQAPSQGAPGSQVLVNGKSLLPGTPVIQVPSADELRGLIVQNGPGNIVVPSAADLKNSLPGIVIQNTLNNQTIRALTMINVAVSVKDALSAARIQESVRQSIASSLR